MEIITDEDLKNGKEILYGDAFIFKNDMYIKISPGNLFFKENELIDNNNLHSFFAVNLQNGNVTKLHHSLLTDCRKLPNAAIIQDKKYYL